MLCRPTFGKYVRPWSSRPTGILASTSPVLVLKTYTVALYRPEAHSCDPSGLSCSMSGLPPPGMCHVATTDRVAKSMTDTEPSSRLDTYSDFVSRETCRPCAPRPGGMDWVSFIAPRSTTETPTPAWART